MMDAMNNQKLQRLKEYKVKVLLMLFGLVLRDPFFKVFIIGP